MKKLLTMLAAGMTAIGLQATVQSGTSFNDADWPNAEELKLWSSTNGATISATAYTYTSDDFKGGEADPYLPAQFRDTSAGNNLYLQTKLSEPVYRAISVTGDENTPVAETIGENGILVDTLVKFTAYDEDADLAATDANAKLAVWVKEVEAEEGADPTYQLIVTAGKYDSAQQNLVATNYVCALYSALDMSCLTNWVRLTVKSLADMTDGYNHPGHVVFVNGALVTSEAAKSALAGSEAASHLTSEGKVWYSKGAIFPGLISGDKTIKQVGFAGTGWIDDLSITDTIPTFAQAADVFYVTGGEHVLSFTCGGQTWETGDDPLMFELTGAAPDQATNITYEDGYFGTSTLDLGTKEKDATISVGDAQLEAATVTIDGTATKYATLAEAVAAINEATASATLKLGADASGGITIYNGDDDEGVYTITIDLAGKTITQGEEDTAAIYCASYSGLVIQDTVGTGVLQGNGSDDGTSCALVATAKATLLGGTYNSLVSADPIELTADSTGVKILASANEEIEAILPDGKVLKENADGYLVLAEGETTWATVLGAADTNGAYCIDSAEELLAFAQYVNGTDVDALATDGVTFKLTTNIALTVPADGSASIAGIGVPNAKDLMSSDYATYKTGAFKGTFDGGNFTISNVILPRTDYAGLFMSAYGATVKNLKVSLGNATGFATADTKTAAETAANGDYGGGVIVGVSVNTTVENCETVVADSYSTFEAPKALAGIVGYAGGGTVIKGCKNNLNIVNANEKVAGITAIVQNPDNVKKDGFLSVTIEGCTNNGNVTTSKSNGDKAAGLASYVDLNLTIKGVCAQTGTVTGGTAAYAIVWHRFETVTVDAAATITTTQVGQFAANEAIDGLTFAMVADTTATFVKNDALELAGTYKVMASGAAYEFAEVGSITFDTSLATVAVTKASTFSDEDYSLTEAKDTTNEKVITYTLAKKATTPTLDPTKDPVVVKSIDDADKLEITVTVPDEVASTVTVETYKGYFKKSVTQIKDESGAVTGYSVAAVLDEEVIVPDDVAAEIAGAFDTITEGSVAVTTAKPGLYYSVEQGQTLDNMTEGDRVMATSAKVSIPATKFEGSGFYRVRVSVTAK